LGLLDRIFGGRARGAGAQGDGYLAGNSETLSLVWERLRVCPVCGEDFLGHRYALLATTPLASRNRRRIERFLAAAEQRVPRDLAAFHDWNPHGENAEAYAVRCPDGNMAIAVADTEAAPPHFKNVIRCDSLGAERSREVESIFAGGDWKTL
jgi:hypothetical protein